MNSYVRVSSLLMAGILSSRCGTAFAFQPVQVAHRAWFSLEGVSGPGSDSVDVEMSGPGQTLVIRKTGDVTLRIGYNFDLSGFLGPEWVMHSWSIHLDAVSSLATSVFDNGSFTGLSGYNSHLGGTNGTSSFDVGQISNFPPNANGTVGLAYEFNLVINSDNEVNATVVTGDFGPWSQTYQFRDFQPNDLHGWYGRVGPNPATYGFAKYTGNSGWGYYPVILVTEVPEPSSLLLALVGAIALARWRKR